MGSQLICFSLWNQKSPAVPGLGEPMRVAVNIALGGVLRRAGASRKRAVVWTESCGPEVKPPRRLGFGSRLLKRAIEGYGPVWLDFNKTGFTCLMLIDLDHVETPMRETRSPQTVPEFDMVPDAMKH
jgi:hypothetical protein